MSNFIEKDKKKRILVAKYELQRLIYKYMIKNALLPKTLRNHSVKNLNKLPRKGSIIKVRNRCILTGRGRSVLSFCKLSRIKVRELASQGLLAGLKKASW
jgi:small subunit ribosomal protein S14